MKSTDFYLNKITKKELATSKFWNPVVKATSEVNKDTYDDIVVLQTFIDYNIIFQKDGSFDDFQFHRMWCVFYDENMEKYEGYFIETLNYFTFYENKTVILYIDLINYLIDYEHLEKKGTLGYSCHSSVSIYYPIGNKQYNVYYFNSHGNATKHASWEYQKYITRKRTKSIKLNKPLDYYVIDRLINTINKHESTTLTYNYEPTEYFNYMGPNMQQGDTKGICFAFPFLISYYIIKNYRNTNFIEENNTIRRISSYCKMINNGNIHKIIYIIMSSYLYDFTDLLSKDTETNVDDINDIIGRKGGHFVRMILHDFTNLVL